MMYICLNFPSYCGMVVLSIMGNRIHQPTLGPFQGLGGLKHFASSRPSLRSGFGLGDRLGLGLASSCCQCARHKVKKEDFCTNYTDFEHGTQRCSLGFFCVK